MTNLPWRLVLPTWHICGIDCPKPCPKWEATQRQATDLAHALERLEQDTIGPDNA